MAHHAIGSPAAPQSRPRHGLGVRACDHAQEGGGERKKRNETKAGRNELTFVEAGNEFVDDVLQILVQSHGRVRLGLVQRSLTHGTEGPAVHELEVFDVLQEAGATEEVESRAVDQSRGIDQIPAAQEAGDPLVQVNESRTFHSLLRQRRQAASRRRRHRCPRSHGHDEGFRCTYNRRQGTRGGRSG